MNEILSSQKQGYILIIDANLPVFGAFQDPTHNNIITADTFKMYFQRVILFLHYGISSKFMFCIKMYYQHLVAVLEKDIT